MKKCQDSFEIKDALKLEKLQEKNVKNIGSLTKELGIKCDLRCGNARCLHGPCQWEAALEALAARREVLKRHVETEMLAKHRVWSANGVRE